MKLTFIFLAQFVIVLYCQECTNKTIYLNLNEIAFFKSTNFPNLLNYSDYEKCSMNFLLSNYENVWTVAQSIYTALQKVQRSLPSYSLKFFTELKSDAFGTISHLKSFRLTATYFDVFDGGFLINYIENDNNYFSLQENLPPYPISFQGQIVFEETHYCPFESVAHYTPFKFTDDSEIFFVYSNHNFVSHQTTCNWNFMAPKGYSFKIVVLTFQRARITRFLVQNSTDIFLNDRSVEEYKPYYNRDIQLQIFLTIARHTINDVFEAYVSIVKNNDKNVNDNCMIIQDVTIWKNFYEYKIGYQKNERCDYELIVANGTEVLVDTRSLSLEKNADYIKYYEGDDYYGVFIDGAHPIILTSFSNEKERRILFKYQSDSNIQLWGFDLSFTTFICECSDMPFICDSGQEFSIMRDVDYYCANLKCKFIIQPCSTQLTMMSLRFYDAFSNNDAFIINSNGIPVFDIGRNNIPQIFIQHIYVFVNSTNVNIFDITTYFCHLPRSLHFQIKSVSETPIKEVVITSNSTVHFIDFAPSDGISKAELAKNLNGFSIVAYSSVKGYIPIFNNDSLTFSLNSKECFGILDPHKCVIDGDVFALYYAQPVPQRYFAVHTKPFYGCVFEKNIFIIGHYQEKTIISAISTSDNSCSIAILFNAYDSQQFVYISHLWTTASKSNVKVFVGSNLNKLYFEFNSLTSKKWKAVGFFSEAYTIVIPKNTALYMIITGQIVDTNSLEYPEQTIIATPHYNTRQVGDVNMAYSVNLINCTAKFTVLDYKVSVKEDFSIYSNDMQKYYPNKKSDSFLFTNEVINVDYKPSSDANGDDHVLLFIETIEKS